MYAGQSVPKSLRNERNDLEDEIPVLKSQIKEKGEEIGQLISSIVGTTPHTNGNGDMHNGSRLQLENSYNRPSGVQPYPSSSSSSSSSSSITGNKNLNYCYYDNYKL